ncbi:MAG: hypothetical protein WBX15_18995 [Thermoanaerobaculia bacterium]
MKRISMLLFVAALLVPIAALAHEHGHVMGKVKAIDGAKLTITASDGDEVTVKLTNETRIFKGEAAGTREDITVGERIVAHYSHDGNATEVRLPASS